MVRSSLGRAGWALAFVGALGGCAGAENASETQGSEDVGSVQGAIGVRDWPSLPVCTILNRGVVYYVQSDRSVVYCDGNRYQGLTLPSGAAGKDGVSFLVTTTAASITTCPTGGVVLQLGPDSNQDGVLDRVDTVVSVCNGAAGPKGDDGPKGDTGDTGDTGADGSNGSDGKNSLVLLEQEPAGSNCQTGGTKIRTGIDVDGDFLLSEAETTQVRYACNGGCGNEVIEIGEECDNDSSQANGDGCSAVCEVERGYTCLGDVGSQSTCITTVGDGVRADSELCDDGNTVNADGCSHIGFIESGWTCADDVNHRSICRKTPICGDGIVDDTEQCDYPWHNNGVDCVNGFPPASGAHNACIACTSACTTVVSVRP
jgi:cysteine-rich repeat protein